MEQVSRRALFGLGIGALAVPVVRLLPETVLPTGPQTHLKIPSNPYRDEPLEWYKLTEWYPWRAGAPS